MKLQKINKNDVKDIKAAIKEDLKLMKLQKINEEDEKKWKKSSTMAFGHV